MSAQKSTLRPGDFVKVPLNHASRYAGLCGLLVAVDGEQAGVKFTARRVHPFLLRDLRRVVGGVGR